MPLKVVIPHGAPDFPLTWPALHSWALVHRLGGGAKSQGLTGCSVVTPDGGFELASTGSAFVWEMFDSIAYDAARFGAMLEAAASRWQTEMAITSDAALAPPERRRRLAAHRAAIDRARAEEGRFRLPPRGFSVEGAARLFEMTGDLAPPPAR